MTVIRKWARLDPEQRAEFTRECRRLYEEGSSVREIASETGRSYGTVHGALVAAGVTFRPRGNPGGRGR